MKKIKKQILYFLKEYKRILLIGCIAFLYTLPLFQQGFFLGHDNQPQVARIAARIKALQDGQFPPRWAADINFGYGHPGFIFFYSLSSYLGAFMYFLGFSLENGYEILMAATFVLAPVFFYLWSSKFLKKGAFLASVFYGLAPYSFLDTFVRAHLGESLSLALIPPTLYFIERSFKVINLKNIILGGVSYALLILSHSILSFIFSFVFFSYILLRGFRKKRILLSGFSILAIGLLLPAYFWIPAIYEGKYINSKIFLSDWYKGHFLNVSNIIYSSWGFGSNVNEEGGLSAQIGPLHTIFALISIGILLKKSKGWIHIAYWLGVLLCGVFISTAISDFLWRRSHFLQQFQFPWRFTALSVFAASVLTGYVIEKINSSKLSTVALILLLVLSLPMAKVWKNESKGDTYYFNYPGTAAYHNEATTVWTQGDAYEYPKTRVEIISGNGRVFDLFRKSNYHSFIVDAKTEVRILDNTVYFPGWQAFLNGQKVPIEFQDILHRGLITFSLPKGTHNVEVRFNESPIRLVSDIISIATALSILSIIVFQKRKYLFFQRS